MKRKILFKRMASVILAGSMVMGCLTGCGEAKPSSNSSETSTNSSQEVVETSETVVVEEPAELTYYGQLLGAATTLESLNDMEIMAAANEATNCAVTYVHPSGASAAEDFNLRIASMELDDIMEYTWGSYPGSPTQAMEDGIIIDLAPYLEKGYAPNYKKILDENPEIAKQVTTDDGRVFAFACIGNENVTTTSGYVVRKDFLDDVGLDVPVTIADWEKMLTAFKEELGLPAPFGGRTGHIVEGPYAWLAGAWDTYADYYVRDGKVQYGILDESFKDYISTMADWYAKGLIDPEIFGVDNATVKSNMLNGKTGVCYGAIGGVIGTYTTQAKAIEGNDPDYELVGVPYPVMNEGDVPQFINRSADVRPANQAAITTACEDIEAAMRYLDFWYGEEGHMLKNFGIEGLSYEMVNGVPTYTDLILKNPDGLAISAALGRYTRAASPTVGVIDLQYYYGFWQMENQYDAMETWNEYADNALEVLLPAISSTPDEAEELATLTNPLFTYVREELTKFVMGTRKMDDWDNFITSVKGMQVDRIIELKQAAYDRYQAR